MTTNTQTSPVETWDSEPKLRVVGRNGDKAPNKHSIPKMSAPSPSLFRQRRELVVLGWEARAGRLVSMTGAHR